MQLFENVKMSYRCAPCDALLKGGCVQITRVLPNGWVFDQCTLAERYQQVKQNSCISREVYSSFYS